MPEVEYGIDHFDTKEMLNALNLSLRGDGYLWSMKDGHPVQRLDWTVADLVAYVVGKMLDVGVRGDMLLNAVVLKPEKESAVRALKQRRKESEEYADNLFAHSLSKSRPAQSAGIRLWMESDEETS